MIRNRQFKLGQHFQCYSTFC